MSMSGASARQCAQCIYSQQRTSVKNCLIYFYTNNKSREPFPSNAMWIYIVQPYHSVLRSFLAVSENHFRRSAERGLYQRRVYPFNDVGGAYRDGCHCKWLHKSTATQVNVRIMRLNTDADSQAPQFVCIHCGSPAPSLYHDYKGGVIKITHCTQCGSVVDKYVECDPVITCLDALLLKRQAFRHILINSHIKSAWKFTLVLLLCEAFTKLVRQRSADTGTDWLPDHVIYSALEIDLYWNFFLTVIELSCSVGGVLIWIIIWKHVIHKNADWPSVRDCVTGLVLSMMGKILVIPAVLWGHKYSTFYLALSNIFTFASNVQATRVLCPHWSLVLLLVAVLFGHCFSYCVTYWLPTKVDAIT